MKQHTKLYKGFKVYEGFIATEQGIYEVEALQYDDEFLEANCQHGGTTYTFTYVTLDDLLTLEEAKEQYLDKILNSFPPALRTIMATEKGEKAAALWEGIVHNRTKDFYCGDKAVPKLACSTTMHKKTLVYNPQNKKELLAFLELKGFKVKDRAASLLISENGPQPSTEDMLTLAFLVGAQALSNIGRVLHDKAQDEAERQGRLDEFIEADAWWSRPSGETAESARKRREKDDVERLEITEADLLRIVELYNPSRTQTLMSTSIELKGSELAKSEQLREWFNKKGRITKYDN